MVHIQLPTPFSQLKNYFVILQNISTINFAIITYSACVYEKNSIIMIKLLIINW